MAAERQQIPATGGRTFLAVWAALAALLALSIAVALLSPSMAVVLNIVIASFMAALNLLFFMNLRYEGAFLKTILFMVILALAAIILLTFSDVFYRRAG
ncbi:MAG: hypothetical protein M0Z75_00055 [Nitrospiraceae bacterium]|nr:hypothetical protein [Nitrospiraceae bacterium]